MTVEVESPSSNKIVNQVKFTTARLDNTSTQLATIKVKSHLQQVKLDRIRYEYNTNSHEPSLLVVRFRIEAHVRTKSHLQSILNLPASCSIPPLLSSRATLSSMVISRVYDTPGLYSTKSRNERSTSDRRRRRIEKNREEEEEEGRTTRYRCLRGEINGGGGAAIGVRLFRITLAL